MKEEKEKNKKQTKKEKPPINSQEYVDAMIKRSRRNLKIAVISLVIIVILLFALTILALMTMTNSKIIKGVTINSIDVSGLEKAEACKLLEEKIRQRQETIIKLNYQDYEKEINPEELEIKANIEDAVDKAINKGRDNNIFINNYNIFKMKLNNENVDINITYNEDALERNLIEISTNLPGIVEEYSYSVEEDQLLITQGKDGIILDKNNLKEKIISQITDLSKDIETNITIPVQQEKAQKIDMESIYQEIYAEPQDAYIVEEPFQVVVDKEGIDLAVTIDEAKAMLEEEKEEYSIPLKVTKAKITVADLGSRAFPDQLSNATTRYNAGDVARTTNLAIATKKINEYVIQPGETFSYNKALGKRTVENGYKEAGVYENGQVVNGLGGGICQISSTLYNAVLKANLEIVERHNHSFVTSYLDPGLDATVVYGALDFRFKNNRKYPVKIVASLQSGVSSISIYGIKEETEYNIKIVSTRLETIPCAVETIEDPTLPEGTEQVVKNGTNGYKSVTHKYVYSQSGQLISKTQISADTYGTMKKVIHIGTQSIETSGAEEIEPTDSPDIPVTNTPSITIDPTPTNTTTPTITPTITQTPLPTIPTNTTEE